MVETNPATTGAETLAERLAALREALVAAVNGFDPAWVLGVGQQLGERWVQCIASPWRRMPVVPVLVDHRRHPPVQWAGQRGETCAQTGMQAGAG